MGCFRYRTKANNNYWALQWIWVFPEYRAKGVVTSAWGTFEEDMGSFIVEEPTSIPMQYLLLKKNFPEERVEGGYKISLK